MDPSRIGLSGFSGGGITTLVATYDQNLRDPRIKAAFAMAPFSCLFQQGYFGTLEVPLMLLQGDVDIIIDSALHAEVTFQYVNPPKLLVLIKGGNHGFTDFSIDDTVACLLLPPIDEVEAAHEGLTAALGGSDNFVGLEGCRGKDGAYLPGRCVGMPAHIEAARQHNITKGAALAFFDSIFREDARAVGYLANDFDPLNSDVTVQAVP